MSKYLAVHRQLNGMKCLVDPFGNGPQHCSNVHVAPTALPSIGFCKSGYMIIQNLTINICNRGKLSNDLRTTAMPEHLASIEKIASFKLNYC